MAKRREFRTANHLQAQQLRKRIVALKKQKSTLEDWIENNISHKDFESKIREYYVLTAKIIAMEGKTKYITTHQIQ